MNMKERIFIKHYDCKSYEDNFEHGESLNPDSSWNSSDVYFENVVDGYETIEDALKAVCESEHFDFVKQF